MTARRASDVWGVAVARQPTAARRSAGDATSALPERFLPRVCLGQLCRPMARCCAGVIFRSAPAAECCWSAVWDFVEKQFETVRDLAARGSPCGARLRGQGVGSPAPLADRRAPQFRPRRGDLAHSLPANGQPSARSWWRTRGRRDRLICLRRYPHLFAAAVLSSRWWLAHRTGAATLFD